ncbi:MAG: hypothetical protein JKY54_14520, partial [Flavobacteriales bacterium]|nr:hypothetical protein [Flavobacteriales bacterium]
MDPFTEGGSTITFDGTTRQILTAASGEDFEVLVMNNTGTGLILALSSDVTISNTLTLTNGIIDSRTNAAKMILTKDAVVSGVSNASFVQGIIRKFGDVAFTFPVGDSGLYAPAYISAPSDATHSFDCEYFNVPAHSTGYDSTLFEPSINHVSDMEYWMVNRTNGASNVEVTLSWGTRSGGVTNLSELSVVRWDGTKWVDHLNGGTTGGLPAGTITTLGVVTTFSPFTLGSTSGNNPLPVELLSFNAVLNENKVELTWTTASEVNNDYFVIEKSPNGIFWEEVSQMTGAGNSVQLLEYFDTDFEPFTGKSYYRLKQVDFNGEFSYSNIVPINYTVTATESLLVYPNPSDGQNINVSVDGFENQEILVILRDIRGRIL